MMASDPKKLTRDEIKKLSSTYISDAMKSESWTIESVLVAEDLLNASVTVRSDYLSHTDREQFHVSTFTILEFNAQLLVIFTHLLAGYSEKVKEAWMLEETSRYIRPLRRPDTIKVRLTLLKMRRRGGNVYFTFEALTTDDGGGMSRHIYKTLLA